VRHHILAYILAFSTAGLSASAPSADPASASPQSSPAPAPCTTDCPQTPAKPATASPDSPAKRVAKPRKIYTNEDIDARPHDITIEGSRDILQQLNTCFNDVKKQAISFGYLTAFPRSTREEMDDRLANDIEGLQHDPKWQRLLLEMISAHIDYCATRQNSQPPDNSPPHTPTRAEIVEEEERMRQRRPAPTSNYGAAGSAVMSYRWKMNPDPLRASLMVHQYLGETARNCPLPESTAQPSDVDEDP
jgi:hypothetical protein